VDGAIGNSLQIGSTPYAAMIVDEGDHGLNRRSSSAWAKYALALRKISFACRSSRFSRSNALSRAAMSVVSPGLRPLSRSACFSHSLSV
jgi:hypothetical protein